MKKIAFIGGGSYNWTFGFIRQFAQSEKSGEFEVVLMDKNPEALDLVHKVAVKFMKEKNLSLALRKTTRMEEALDGADFVLVTISTGGLDAMRHDLDIPERFGIRHTVGDSVGPGGWSRAVRNIPVFHEIGAAMKRLCPKAWLLNMSNPLTILTRVPHKLFGIKSVGMCPGVETMVRTLAGMAGIPPATAEFDFSVTGIDHGSFFTKLRADGIDVLARLQERGYQRDDGKVPEDVKFDDPLMGYCASRAVFALWRGLGYMPAISDRHAVENYPWFLLADDEKQLFSLKRTTIEERQEGMTKARQRHVDFLEGKIDIDHFQGGHGHDPVPRAIEALCGHGSFLWTSNHPNIGQIPGMPDGAVVETRCLFAAAGVHPLASPMPDIVKIVVGPHILRQEAIIDITLDGTFDELAALVASDPLCARLRLDQCREMTRLLVEANRPFVKNPRLLL